MKIITKTQLFGGFILQLLDKPEELGKSTKYISEKGKVQVTPSIISLDIDCQRILVSFK